MLEDIRVIQRKAIELLYEGVCTIISTVDVKDPDTNITKPQEIILVEDEPCRLSYGKPEIMEDSEIADTTKQLIKLFIKPELNIPSGSLIEVTQHGKTSTYSNSGYPETHGSHQEIILKLDDKYGRLYE